MLKLKDITKIYEVGDLKVNALKGINLCFRKNEFVSILGHSGCGKTTLLNIIGGLDRYTDGDLVINGVSTKEYKDKDWDNYRNHSIGFVFQSYNLIPHQTVLENVELALTLSGVSKAERKRRATEVLIKVGLGDKLKNKPSQLSGGQMQRVAIARALVNDPEIILADEPTGALDTETSVQIMDLLKTISKDKLIIMVTHNPELANAYSTRIVNLLDGNVTGDSDPYSEEDEKIEAQQILEKKQAKEKREKKKDPKGKKKRMSFWTALSLSFKNLLTKKARTILVAFAGSIGIIGIALILAVSSGFSTYINKMQEDTLSTYPITIQSKKVDLTSVISQMFLDNSLGDENHENDGVYAKENISKLINSVGNSMGTNNLEKFYGYINEHKEELKDYVNAVQCTYDLDLEYLKDSERDLDFTNPSDMTDLLDFAVLRKYNVEPNSPAILQMIIKYSLYYFESKTGIGFIDNGNGSYYLLRPTNLNEEDPIEKKYKFIYGDPDDNNSGYSELIPIAVALENPTNEGKLLLSNQQEVLGLVFAVMGLKSEDASSMMSSSSSSLFGSMSIFNEMIDNEEFIKSQYDLIAGEFIKNDAEHSNEAMLVLDKNNELDDYVLYTLGLMTDEHMNSLLQDLISENNSKTAIAYNDIIGKTIYRVLDKADYFVNDPTDGVIDFRTYNMKKLSDGVTDNPKYDTNKYYYYLSKAYNECNNKIKIVGILRLNENTDNGALSTGVVYSKYFTQQMIKYREDRIIELGETETELAKKGLEKINLNIPSKISIYINSFESKDNVKDFIEKYNNQADKNDKITYTDYIDIIMSTVSTIINAITYVLIAFVSVSLVVSSIMIGIITYISVIERTKEIGVLRSVGASKRDIKHVFTAESFIIGLSSGLLGIGISLLLILPINLILAHFTGIGGLANLPVLGSVALVLISIILTFISGLIPANAAAKKDPVIALREN